VAASIGQQPFGDAAHGVGFGGAGLFWLHSGVARLWVSFDGTVIIRLPAESRSLP
jgi:hypothetical protein